ncbi:hypothetical protein BT63DRAFT_415836 [Microthyrium microscopicum]|uniref:tRNA (guanine(9)-N1)-methyltransferase n=1 Tax=Microthyrium microscopicum TaxID=703497 RepID=A0A6A6U5K9_9PEZI|nr:hypothetical protein BT63DRAFT_415836 [Microthyrium microscopicum]
MSTAGILVRGDCVCIGLGDSRRRAACLEAWRARVGRIEISVGEMDDTDHSERPTKIRKTSHSPAPMASNITSADNSSSKVGGGADTAQLPDINSLLPAEACKSEEVASREQEQGQAKIEDGDNQNASTEPPTMSKNAQKKLRKKQEWEAGRGERAIKRKEKRIIMREKKREEIKANPALAPVKKAKLIQTPVAMTFIIDCAFDELMFDNEVVSLGSQITTCYNRVKHCKLRPILAVSSFGGRLQERFDVLLKKQYQHWRGVHFLTDDVKDVAKKAEEWMKDTVHESGGVIEASAADMEAPEEEDKRKGWESAKMIYLSADSSNVLTTLSPNTCYVVGGLIDRNRHKGHCFKRARTAGITTARLPIGEYIQLSSRKVLTTNHVVEIMLRYLENRDWAKSFLDVIPARKGVALKGGVKATGSGDDQEAENDDECEGEEMEELEGEDIGKREDEEGKKQEELNVEV